MIAILIIAVLSLAVYGLAGVIAMIFKWNVMLIFGVLLVLILVIPFIIYALNALLSEKQPTKKKIKKHDLEKSGVVFKIVLSVIIIFDLLGLRFIIADVREDINNPSPEEIKRDQEHRACYNRSNTYYKCNWDVIEDRCVCKAR